MDLRIAVFDADEERKKRIHAMLEAYAFECNLVYQVLWASRLPSPEKRAEYLPGVALALINLDSPGAFSMGKALYALNPDCRIYYYRSRACNLEPLLCTRPIRFCAYPMPGGPEEADFSIRLREVFQELEQAEHIFSLETRAGLRLIPCSQILYFMSDLKYVHILLKNGEDISVFRKLTDMEPDLGSRFVRIHKRYIVNRTHVRLFDKAERTVQMDNGEVLSVSDARYEDALRELRET